ncbi:alpha beta-hydrolase [Fusarium agapanthi]|uniref:Alpha beta-hydrolase n=1 Tax=Fusarium agapanthi TaxID=1803897 RepID=A0A9P5BAF3_9HYPO|nr:alpha beta-hydrolase [Fusarium agapanthi]
MSLRLEHLLAGTLAYVLALTFHGRQQRSLIFTAAATSTILSGKAGFSLEGQTKGQGPDFSDPRQAFCLSSIADGRLLDAVFPSGDWKKVDPLLNISQSFPPTFIVHGDADTMLPLELSLELYSTLKESGVECGMCVIPGEEHTFAARMKNGSDTWNLQLEG